MGKRQQCQQCKEPSLRGLPKGQGLCAYHWAATVWGKAWADKCYPNHPEARKP